MYRSVSKLKVLKCCYNLDKLYLQDSSVLTETVRPRAIFLRARAIQVAIIKLIFLMMCRSIGIFRTKMCFPGELLALAAFLVATVE